MTDKNTIIEVKNLFKTFDGDKMILQGISYEIKKGEKLVLVSNLARKQQQIKINLPAGSKQVINAETEKVLPIVNNTVTLDIPRNDFGFIIIKK